MHSKKTLATRGKRRKKATLRRDVREKSGLTRSQQLYVALSGALRDEAFVPGQMLPSEPELVRRYQVSRSTVRRALDRLEEEGRIERKHGSGTYVKELSDAERFYFEQSNLREKSHAMEKETVARWLTFEQSPVPPRLLKLAPEFGPQALHLERTRSRHGQTFAVVAAYISLQWAGKLSKRRMGNRFTSMALREVGVSFSYAQQFYGAIVADQRLSKLLGIQVGVPLLHVTSIFRDRAGQVTHFEEWSVRPDLHTLHTTIQYA